MIEDIDRLTDAAANALLKILEEPLPGRLLIATTSQALSLLPTILSRALLFSFFLEEDTEILAHIAQNDGFAEYDTAFLCAVA